MDGQRGMAFWFPEDNGRCHDTGLMIYIYIYLIGAISRRKIFFGYRMASDTEWRILEVGKTVIRHFFGRQCHLSSRGAVDRKVSCFRITKDLWTASHLEERQHELASPIA